MRDFFPHSPVLREGDALDRLLLLLAGGLSSGGLSSGHSDRAARLGGRQLAPTWRGVVHAFGELRQEVHSHTATVDAMFEQLNINCCSKWALNTVRVLNQTLTVLFMTVAIQKSLVKPRTTVRSIFCISPVCMSVHLSLLSATQ